jgi:histidine triad (HIT) family protein
VSTDFYCEQVLSGLTPVDKIAETETVLAFHHTRPFYLVHIVVIPKQHIASLIVLEPVHNLLILELFAIIKPIAAQVVSEHGACRILTNLGNYQDSKHLHWHIISGEPLRKTDI